MSGFEIQPSAVQLVDSVGGFAVRLPDRREGPDVQIVGTVTLDGLASEATVVKLRNERRDSLGMPDVVTVPAGSKSAAFNIAVIRNEGQSPVHTEITAFLNDVQHSVTVTVTGF